MWPSTIVHGGGNLVVAAGIDVLTGSALSVTGSTLLYIAAMVPVVGAVLVWPALARWNGVGQTIDIRRDPSLLPCASRPEYTKG